jgi:hypothetical protein
MERDGEYLYDQYDVKKLPTSTRLCVGPFQKNLEERRYRSADEGKPPWNRVFNYEVNGA